MDGKVLVIVESPTKARTIRKFLPENYVVEASIGHIRDLPQSAAEIPKAFKKEPWARLGIDVDSNFSPLYVTPRGKGKVIQQLKRQLKDASQVLLATDEDREGESISWHLTQVLKPKVSCKRMVFHEITKRAILHALEHGRDIDMDLVNAQETRRILDRLYGYTLSPLIWKKIAYGLSAGRVQSPGLRLIVDRERERILFEQQEYWDAKAQLRREEDSEDRTFEAKLEKYQGKRIAGSRDFDSTTGAYRNRKDALLLKQEDAGRILQEISGSDWIVESVTEKTFSTRPAPPFITSTLQQEGNRKLHMSARETMRTAQRLYEKGFITYMRTDSPNLSQEGIQGIRHMIQELYGESYLSKQVRQYGSKAKSAQEAHEAIRPAGERFLKPELTGLEGREKALYSLIWKRTMAAQMADGQKATTTVKISAGDAQFSASGTRILFPGFIRVYVEGKDDPESILDDKESWLPELKEEEKLAPESVEAVRHETKPPARFTEASLVRELERMDIGRPSTYASIINTLYQREYIRKDASALVPTFTGFAVIQLLEHDFKELIEYSFTSDMEDALDEIAVGKVDRLEYLKSFYLGENGLKNRVEQREKSIDPKESKIVKLPQISSVDGIRIGKFGPYVLAQNSDGGEEIHASVPEDIAPSEITDNDIEKIIEIQKEGPEPLGHHPETGEPIYLLTGRYGPYFQLGEKSDDNRKPKRASVPSGKKAEDFTLDEIVKLLSLPRSLGTHPDTGKEITANIGRFGPYVHHDGEFRSLKKEDDVYTVKLDRALEILAEPKRGRGNSSVILDLGKSSSGKSLQILSGKYGPYIKHGTKNAALPKTYKDEEKIRNLSREEVETLLQQKVKKTQTKKTAQAKKTQTKKRGTSRKS